MSDIDFETGVWAVVRLPGGEKVIGSITEVHHPANKVGDWFPSDKENVLLAIEHHQIVCVKNAFGLTEREIPVPGPDGSIGINRMVQCVPLDNAIEASTLYTIIVGAHFFQNMASATLERHKGLVKQVVGMLAEVRLRQAGLTLAKPGDMPRGDARRS